MSQGRASLRSRLILVTAVSCACAFALSGGVLYYSLRTTLYKQFDETLDTRAQALAALVEQYGEDIHVESDSGSLPDYRANQRRDFYQLCTAEGRIIERSASLGGKDLPVVTGVGAGPVYEAIILPDGRKGRMIAYAFTPRHPDSRPVPDNAALTPCVMLVAGDTRHTTDVLFHFARQLVLVCLGAIGITAVALSALITRRLGPVRDLADQISSVGRMDLAERLDPGPAPAELEPVVHRLNDLLSRVSAAFDREKSFTADVAHELRTPISALEAALEVSASREREPAIYRQTMEMCLKTVKGMHSLVDRLLTLARADARQLTIRPEPLVLREMLDEAWGPFAERAKGRGILRKWDLPAATVLNTDPELLGQILTNLFDNAVSYAPEGSVVRVWKDGGERLVFENPAPGDLSAEQVERVFDRFWRGDRARPDTAHAGLGLPLVQKLMTALGGAAGVALEGGMFRLTLSFPGSGVSHR